VLGAEVSRSGGPAFDRAALQAIVAWRFEPAKQGGAPLQARIRVPFAFPAPPPDPARPTPTPTPTPEQLDASATTEPGQPLTNPATSD
ncbi:MAG: TonB family protein, partial [Nannocystaceae bacterium]